MHTTGVPDWTLMAIGRWRSLGFMAYIQHGQGFWSAWAPSLGFGTSKQAAIPWSHLIHISYFHLVSLHPLHQPPHLPIWPPKLLLNDPSGIPFHNFQAKVGPDAPVGIQPTTSNQTSVQISHLGSSWNFLTKMTSTSPSWGPFQNSQAITHGLPRAHTHSQPEQNSITHPQLDAFTISHQENILPHTRTTTHLTFPPRLLTLAPLIIRLTHAIYQAAFAAPRVILYSYSRLDPTSGSSPGYQSRIQSWI